MAKMPETLQVKVDTSDFAPILAADPANQAVPSAAGSTEYERAKSSGFLAAVLVIAGILVTAGSTIVDAVTGIDPKAGQIAGAVLAVVGAVYRAYVDGKFIQGRADLKTATATGAANVAVAKITGAAPPGATTITTTTETGGMP